MELDADETNSLSKTTWQRRTIELTRRREFNQASPDESSCETRFRRSRPTICCASSSDVMNLQSIMVEVHRNDSRGRVDDNKQWDKNTSFPGSGDDSARRGVKRK